MSRPRHPNKHIEAAVQYAESLGWRVESRVGMLGGGCFVRSWRERDASSSCGRRRACRSIMLGTFVARLIDVFTRMTRMERQFRDRGATNMKPLSECLAEHEFTLVLTGLVEITNAAADALFEAGCDDSTVSMRHGRVYMTFSRAAPSLKEAILGAIQDVRRAGVGADVLRVDECDLVTQADIARRMGRSRQLVNQYVAGLRGPGGFPPPVCDIVEGTPLWYWCEVARWLFENDMLREEEMRESLVVAAINSVLELQHRRRVDPELAEEVMGSLG